MPGKPKSPAKIPAKPVPASAPPNPLRQADTRWQRTVRYGWDKGGAKGGRK